MLPLIRSKVSLGVALPWNVRNREGNLLLKRGQMVADEHQLELLLERGAFVDVEEVRAAARDAQESLSRAARVAPAVSVFDLWQKLPGRLRAVVRVMHLPGEFRSGLAALVQELLRLTEEEGDIGIYLAVRQEQEQHIDYGYAHSVHAAMVCTLLSRALGWPAADTEVLCHAALTMNLSILDLQGRMAAQEPPILPSQTAQIRLHPTQTVQWLQHAGIDDAVWLRAIADHHEHADGSGYPAGITDIGPMARALRVADVFTAKLSPRILRAPLAVQAAERQLLIESKLHPATTEMTMALIKHFGIYPPGDLVQLKSGEIGVVIHRRSGANTPTVAVLTDTHGKPGTATPQRDTADPAFAIVAAVADKKLVARLAPERVFGYSLAHG